MNYVKELPQDAEQREKKKKALTAKRKALSAMCFVCAVVGIALLVATLVMLIAAELGNFGEDVKNLLFLLCGCFLGGALVFALIAILFARAGQNAADRELDFLERCDDENSFFVGEGTLATFGNGQVTLHGGESGKVIFVPYDKMRFFSVCTRHRPKEKGEWSVVLEIPTHYLTKGKAEKDAPPALVQTDYKPRLADCLAREGLHLIGQTPQEGEKKSYRRVRSYTRPDKQKRKRSLILIALGAVLCAACLPVAFLWEPTFGAVFGVLGAFLLGRSVYSFVNAKSMLVLYDGGMWWKESTRNESVFLGWEEIVRVEEERAGEQNLLSVQCPYGAYHFFAFEGAAAEMTSLKESYANAQ